MSIIKLTINAILIRLSCKKGGLFFSLSAALDMVMIRNETVSM